MSGPTKAKIGKCARCARCGHAAVNHRRGVAPWPEGSNCQRYSLYIGGRRWQEQVS